MRHHIHFIHIFIIYLPTNEDHRPTQFWVCRFDRTPYFIKEYAMSYARLTTRPDLNLLFLDPCNGQQFTFHCPPNAQPMLAKKKQADQHSKAFTWRSR